VTLPLLLQSQSPRNTPACVSTKTDTTMAIGQSLFPESRTTRTILEPIRPLISVVVVLYGSHGDCACHLFMTENMTRRLRRQPPPSGSSATTTTTTNRMNYTRLPAFFATTIPTAPRRVWLFDAMLVTDPDTRRDIYRVRPSIRFARWNDEHPGFLMDDGERSEWQERNTFVVDRPPRHGHVADVYHGGYMLPAAEDWDRTRDVPMRWRFAGATIYSMLCPDPIPLIIVDRPDVLPMIAVNELRTTQGTRLIHRAWRQRWDPEFVTRSIENLQAAIDARRRARTPSPPRPIAGAAGAVAPVVGSADAGARSQNLPQPLPKFVVDALIRDAVAAEATCPITMEPITAATAAVTSCFHVFDANAIAIWLVDNHTCPTCKTRTVV
jgi:hypothetical protein